MTQLSQSTHLRVVFMGTPDFAVSSLDAICKSTHQVVGVVTSTDKPTGRGLKISSSAVKNYAIEHSIPILQPEKLRDPAFLDALRAFEADIFVVVAFRMLPRQVWAMPPMGTFNLHASLLPQYRGAAPINWAIINGETQTGVTTFLLNEHIDEGKILMQRPTDITLDDNAESLHDRLANIGKDLVVETLDGLANGTLTPQEQLFDQKAELRGAPKLFTETCTIDWNKGGEEICNFVRGLCPMPAARMAVCTDKGERQIIKVFETYYEPGQATVGEIICDGKKIMKIGCSNGFVHIKSLQLNGKRRNSIEEFLRGHSINNWKIIS